MADFLSDTFTDTDGTLVDAHTPGTGGAWTKLAFSAGGAADPANAMEVRSNVAAAVSNAAANVYRNAAAPSSAEYDVTADIVVSGIARAAYLCARMTSSGTTSGAVDYYYASFGASSVSLNKWVSNAATSLGTWAGSGSASVKLQIRTAAKKVFVATVERISSADDTITQTGRVGIAATLQTATIDNLLGTNTSTTTSLSVAGAVTPAGALLKTANKPLAGALTPSGTLAAPVMRGLSVSGALTPTGVLARVVNLGLAGSLTPTGNPTKVVSHTFAGSITPTGTASVPVLGSTAYVFDAVAYVFGNGLVSFK